MLSCLFSVMCVCALLVFLCDNFCSVLLEFSIARKSYEWLLRFLVYRFMLLSKVRNHHIVFIMKDSFTLGWNEEL